MFGFPVAPKTHGFKLRQNLLKTVVFQVKFPSDYGVLARQTELRQALASTFPQAHEVKYQELNLGLVEQTPIVSSKQGNTEALEFRTADQQKIFTVRENELALTILGPQYVNFEAVQQDLHESIYKIGNLLGLTTLTRTAIRKINLVNFQADPAPLSVQVIYQTVFHNLLTLSASAVPAAPYFFSGISNYRYHHDAYRLNLVYGLLPDPALDGDRQFVLDIDLANTATDQQYESLSNSLLALNNEVFNIFSWCINPSLVGLLNATEISPAA